MCCLISFVLKEAQHVDQESCSVIAKFIKTTPDQQMYIVGMTNLPLLS